MSTSDAPLVMLVEDDVRLARLVDHYLQGHGLHVRLAHRGQGVAEEVRHCKADLLILDLGLPDCDGFTLCREVRAHSALPILILTARNNDIDQVMGLELGADDYVVKPAEPRVLLARIQALLRRSRAVSAPEHRLLRFGALSINPAARAVTLHEQPVALSSNEFDLLLFLATHAGEIQSRETLYQQLYRREYNGLDRTLDVRISHLRRKLADTGNPEKIRTVWGHGYLFVPDAW